MGRLSVRAGGLFQAVREHPFVAAMLLVGGTAVVIIDNFLLATSVLGTAGGFVFRNSIECAVAVVFLFMAGWVFQDPLRQWYREVVRWQSRKDPTVELARAKLRDVAREVECFLLDRKPMQSGLVAATIRNASDPWLIWLNVTNRAEFEAAWIEAMGIDYHIPGRLMEPVAVAKVAAKWLRDKADVLTRDDIDDAHYWECRRASSGSP